LILGDATKDSVDGFLKQRNTEGWKQVYACNGCWLECTAGVSMMLKNPLKEASQLVGLWAGRKNK
jgi:hypothetical protein